MSAIQSSLARHVTSELSPEESEALRRRAWREHQILVISPDDLRLNWMQEQVIRQLGSKLYGDFNKKGTV